MSIGINEAKVIGIFFEACLCGALAVMYIFSLWTLIYNRPFHPPLCRVSVFLMTLMFIFPCMHLGTSLSRILRVLFRNGPETIPLGTYWHKQSERTQVFSSALYVVQTLVGDFVAMYRTYIVWNKRHQYSAVPALTYMGSWVTGVGTLIIMSKTPDSELFVGNIHRWHISFFVCTLTHSLICTGLIASRIWYLGHRTLSRGKFSSVARGIAESGAVYSSVLVALIVTDAMRSWFAYVLLDALAPIIGMVFSIIIVRVGMGIAMEPDTIEASSSPNTFVLPKSSKGSDSGVKIQYENRFDL